MKGARSYKFEVFGSKLRRFFNLPLKNHTHPKFKAPNRALNEQGFTFVELMISVAILALVTPAIVMLFTKVSQGFAADEMHTLLKKNNQETMNRLHARLGTCKRIFQNDAVGNSFLYAVTFSSMTGAPPLLSGSQLPLAQTGSLSPVTATPADFGNSLFFAAYDTPQTIVNGGTISIFQAPATLLNVPDSGATLHTFYVDLYRFYYYYLTATNPHGLLDAPSYALVEWESTQYADYLELNNLYYISGGVTTGDATLQANAISMLAAQGVTRAFDASSTVTASAFHSVTISGTVMPNVPGFIQQAQWKTLTYMSGGALSAGFKYGISANSANWSAPVKVPQFAATVAGTPFPGGFEVGVAGTSAGREVMIRSVLVAKGAAPKVEVNDLVDSTNARDIW